MYAQSLSSQYELTATDRTDTPPRPSVTFPGDFAAGLRASPSDPAVSGDFATGARRVSPLTVAGDFATGLRADPAAERIRGNFATGQRGDRASSAGRQGQPTHGALPAVA
jgi:hypothetical protein